ncbi:OmpA family protein [Tenacibaculum soleae]|uniref:OmpA family protein n=1 Tax=Tenacibaculum soleae TaxID=447689 RepID=UPI0023019050|nr:OmpA family protein [Tenacibaculum soleae]
MANINTLDQGAKILQNVDVSSIVTGLALGIADAQERLDTNSVKQITRLSEVEVGGRSLLELGFQPSFYAFEYADVSASINLKMTVQEELEIDFSLEYDSTKKKGYTDEHIQKVENEYKEEKYKEFKSSRKYWTTASNVHALKVNQSTVNTSTKEGSIDRLEETAENLSSDSEIQRVDSKIIETKDVVSISSSNDVRVHNYNGLGMLSLSNHHTAETGIIKITNTTNFNASTGITINTVGSPKKITSSNIVSNCKKIKDSIDVYFDFSKYNGIDFTYTKGGFDNVGVQEELKMLSLIMFNDSTANAINDNDLSIKIIGHTDSVSGENFNLDLGLKRAKAVKNYLITLGVPASKILETISEGEKAANAAGEKDGPENPEYRKVTIEIEKGTNDYYYIIGGNFSFSSSTLVSDWSSSTFGIFRKFDTSSAVNTTNFEINSGSDINISDTVNSLSDIDTNSNVTDKFYSQISGDIVYLLRKDAKVEYTLFSDTNEEITIEEDSTSTQTNSSNEDSLNIHKVINNKYFAKSDLKSIKDPKVSAWSGSLDVRYARQFGVSVEGNASVSARMISVPPPTGLENYIESLTGNTTSGS